VGCRILDPFYCFWFIWHCSSFSDSFIETKGVGMDWNSHQSFYCVFIHFCRFGILICAIYMGKRIINITGKQYFLLTISVLSIFVVGTYIFEFLGQVFEFLFLPWLFGLLVTSAILAIYGIVVLFRTYTLRERLWIWFGIALNLFFVFSLIFANLGYG